MGTFSRFPLCQPTTSGEETPMLSDFNGLSTAPSPSCTRQREDHHMTPDLVALTAEKTLARFERNTARTIRNEGFGSTKGSLKITKDCIEVLSQYIDHRLKYPQVALSELKASYGPATDDIRTLLSALRQLDSNVVAMCSLNRLLHAAGKGDDLRAAGLSLGFAVQNELWAAGLLRKDEELAARIEKSVRKKHAGVKQRQQAARSIALHAGYKGVRWSKEATLRAGNVLVNFILGALPDVFYMDTIIVPGRTHTTTKYLPRIRPEAEQTAINAVTAIIQSHPVQLPCFDPPTPWTALHSGGYPDKRMKGRQSLLRWHSKQQGAAVRAAIANGTMRPVLDSVNALQAVAWKINARVLDVITHCIENKIVVKGLPRATPYEKPPHGEWTEMSDDQQRAWKKRANKIEEKNRGLIADRVLLTEDMGTARLMAQAEQFYTPVNADWRGRVYPLPHFNFQRDDRVRALFVFANGEPIGERGLYWLKIHVANCGDFDKISKRPLWERELWTDSNLEALQAIASDPMANPIWMQADKPFLFLAAVFELTRVIACGVNVTTTLPVSFDGSCSGLQHLAAMTRDLDTATLVNLTPNETPQDVYQTVADLVVARVALDAEGTSPASAVAKLCLAHGITRKLVKRNVMTYSYGSEAYGMGKQHMEDLMRPLELAVMAGEVAEHPYGEDNGREASQYLAKHIYAAIVSTVKLPAQAMGFLQTIARVMAHEGKAATWTTPAGLPWVNSYFHVETARVRQWLHDAFIKLYVAVGDKKEVDKDRAANGSAPNFVHACDAAHLMLSVNAAVRDGITNIATVHDSFGCLPSQADRFNEIIREQFVLMYEQHDVLAEVLEHSKCDLTQHNWRRLPECPGRGSLNVKEVLNAQYAFA